MSIVRAAIEEMQLANFDEDDIVFVVNFLNGFFDRYDSGGAVWAMSDVLMRLIKGQPLTPLTGKDDEWVNVSMYGNEPVFQNRRCGTVFKDSDGRCYDIDTPGRPTITFPYDPTTKPVSSPVIEMEV
jgi:hypothetical protein